VRALPESMALLCEVLCVKFYRAKLYRVKLYRVKLYRVKLYRVKLYRVKLYRVKFYSAKRCRAKSLWCEILVIPNFIFRSAVAPTPL